MHIYIHTVIDFEEGCRKMKKEKERIICAIPKGDIYHNTVNTDEKSPAGQAESDLQAELSEKAAVQPEAEDLALMAMR